MFAQQLRKARATDLLNTFEEELQDFVTKDVESAVTSTATYHAQQSEALMQQVWELGHLPRESQSEPKEQLLAQQLRKSRATGLFKTFEEELHNVATKYVEVAAANIATEHAQQTEVLIQQVWELGHLSRESQR